MKTERPTHFGRPVHGEFAISGLKTARKMIDIERQTPGYCDANQREYVGQMFAYFTPEERETATALGFEAC